MKASFAALLSCLAVGSAVSHAQLQPEYRKMVTYYCQEGKVILPLIAHEAAGPFNFEDPQRGADVQSRCSLNPPKAAAPKQDRSAHRAVTSTVHEDAAEVQAVTVSATPSSFKEDTLAPVGLGIIVLLICAYLFPLSVAMYRDCEATAGIVVVNLFLGWTFIGWVVALAWAASGKKKQKPIAVQIPT
jgi:hypothetical protein